MYYSDSALQQLDIPRVIMSVTTLCRWWVHKLSQQRCGAVRVLGRRRLLGTQLNTRNNKRGEGEREREASGPQEESPININVNKELKVLNPNFCCLAGRGGQKEDVKQGNRKSSVCFVSWGSGRGGGLS